MAGATNTNDDERHSHHSSTQATPARCHYPIERGEEWHLDQNDERDGYLGVSHARCNLSAAGDKTLALHGHNGHRHPTRFHAKHATSSGHAAGGEPLY